MCLLHNVLMAVLMDQLMKEEAWCGGRKGRREERRRVVGEKALKKRRIEGRNM